MLGGLCLRARIVLESTVRTRLSEIVGKGLVWFIESSDNENERRTHIKYAYGTANLTTIYQLQKCASRKTNKDCAFGLSASRATAWQMIRARTRSSPRDI